MVHRLVKSCALLFLLTVSVLSAPLQVPASYRNRQLRVVTGNFLPFVYAPPDATGVRRVTGGFVMDLLDEVLKILDANITYTYIVATSGGVKVGSTWTGMVGHVFNGTADMAAAGLTITQARSAGVDFVYPYMDDGMGLLVKSNGVKYEMWGFFFPFAGAVWGAIILYSFILSLIVWGAEQASPYSATNERKALIAKGVSPKEIDMESFSYADSFYNVFLIVIGKGELILNSWGTRLIFFALLIFSVVTLANYTANLTSFLTVPQRAESVINNIKDLQSYKFGVLTGSSGFSYIQTYHPELVPNMITKSLNVDLLALLANDTIKAMIGDTKNLQFIANSDPCDKYIAGGLISNFHYGFALPKATTPDQIQFFQAMNAATLQLRDRGIVDNLYKSWWRTGYCGTPGEVSSRQLVVQDMYGLFIVVAIVLGISLVILAFETFYGSFYHRTLKAAQRGKDVKAVILSKVLESIHFCLGGDESAKHDVMEASRAMDQ